MRAGGTNLLAVCGGGGNDALALIVLLVVVLLWFAALRIPFSNAEDGTEGLILVALSVVAVLNGALLFLYPHGISGNGDYFTRFLVSLPISGAIALAVAALSRRVSPGRALFVAIAGDLFIPGFLIVGFISSLVVGSGCIE